jgi:hypothetical protein
MARLPCGGQGFAKAMPFNPAGKRLVQSHCIQRVGMESTHSSKMIVQGLQLLSDRRARSSGEEPIVRQNAVSLLPPCCVATAAIPTSSGTDLRCRRRYLCCSAIAFRKAIATLPPSRCQPRVMPKRSGLSCSVSCSQSHCRPSSGVRAIVVPLI